MGAGESETGLGVVVEGHQRPAARGVAGVALLTLGPLMDIVIFMATDAIFRCVVEGGRRVTLVTFEDCVPAEQRKSD